ncbi:HNH endonuclease signature motif containing protein [Pseudomonas sp. sp1636]|uniref:HNH endonuclease n=1 Tax=Pseudomonas sp. sp1636 TaxID=3036707 RepID=UPI0025A53107|nr:HNH endonuclease signature motif containing protein [Pseudomonas sp. sp1636]MDM8350602.1 HNH endonuclease signature motif containing protein [Pseudomonas sp. sp1636]
MKYYYAYHGSKNKENFDWKFGYGLTSRSKRDKVAIGSKVIVIQKPDNAIEFRLCGIFKITKHYDDMTNVFPYRFELENVSNLSEYMILNDTELSDELPAIIGGNKGWSNFQKHFCAQGITFQKLLEPEVSDILLSQIGFQEDTLESVIESFRKKVIISSKMSSKERRKRLNLAKKNPKQKTVTTIVYERNPDVVAEVLYRAEENCEKCFKRAPFNRKSDGSPYLEVHHKVPLARGGDDTVENAIAICPNCHREAHYG